MESKLDYLEITKEKVLTTINNFTENGLDKNTFCIMPFVNIILEPDGEIGVCRHKGTEFTFGNIRTQTIDEIWSSPRVTKWREELISGQPQICKNELIDCRCNLCPELNTLLDKAEVTNSVNPKVLRLTANLNGKCNLQCQMCSVWKMPNGFYTEENFWIPARERFFKDILEVDMLSGEPFIQQDTYRLIDEVSSVNPKCLWTITTNLHWKLTEKTKQYLDRISIKNIIVSIDSLDEKIYGKIRPPGDLNFVLSNLEEMLIYEKQRVLESKSKLNVRLNCLVQKDNWKEIKNIIQYCFEKNIIPFVTFLYEPDVFSLLNFETSKRIEILNFYFETLTKEEILLSQRVIKPLIRSLDKFEYTYFINLLHERIVV
jgi:cyclic pyranopterin phosphate synthase